jgi:23S rRNA-/tRNA-specific pseudouridylate synthase
MYGPEADTAEEPEVPLMLHAYRAGFRQPFTFRKILVEAPLPYWAERITAAE